jgi:hypothetical protein
MGKKAFYLIIDKILEPRLRVGLRGLKKYYAPEDKFSVILSRIVKPSVG